MHTSPARISRPHLLDAIGRQRLTVIRAAAGSGKTSLIVEWLSEGPARGGTAWVMLDEHCRSAASFWHRVIATMVGQDVIGRGGAAARILTGEADASAAPGLLIAELNGRATESLLVVDDLHLLDDDAQDQLLHLVTHAHRLHLIVATRTLTRVETPDAATRVGLTTLTRDDLVVTDDELPSLSATAAELSASDRQRLLTLTRGNMLAVRLALATVDHARADGDTTIDLIENVAGRMSQNILTSFASAADLDDALRLALPPAVDRDLASALLGRDADAALQTFTELGTGQTIVDGARATFVFHPLVRSALLARANAEMDPDELRRLRLLCAAHLTAWGDPVDVLTLLVEADAEEHAWAYFVQLFSVFSLHRIDDVIRALEGRSDSSLRAQGRIAILLAIELSEREARPSRRVLDLTRWGLDHVDALPATDDPLERCLRLTARLGAHRAARRYADAAAAGEALIAEIAALPSALHEQIGPALLAAAMQAMITSVLSGRFDTAIAQSAALVGDPHAGRRRHVSGLLAYVHAYRGHMPRARTQLGEVVVDLDSTWTRTVQGVGWNFARSLLAMENEEYADARQALAPFEYRSDRFEHWPTLLWVEATLGLLEGDTVAAHDALTRSVREHRGRVADPSHLDALTAVRADLARAVGENALASRILRASPGGPATDLAQARVLLAEGRARDALDLIRDTRAFHNWPRRLAEAELVRAAAASRLGLPDQARAGFERAGAVLQRFELTSPLVFVSEEDRQGDASTLGMRRAATAIDPFRLRGGDLSPRELLVLKYLRSDESLPRLAERLHVSPNTVKSQVTSIYRKLGVDRRAAAVQVASERGLV